MDSLRSLLTCMLHFTPYGYIACASLLFMRRKEGDRSRIILAVSFIISGLLLMTNLIYHYNNVAETNRQTLFVMLLVFFSTLPYPIEMIKPGSLTGKKIKDKRSRVNIRWIQWFGLGTLGFILLNLLWATTGSTLVWFIILFCCLIYCVTMTYQELYLRLPLAIDKKSSTQEKQADAPAKSATWDKWIQLLEQQKYWRNPDLTLNELAALLGTNRTTLTNQIKEAGYDGFCSLINTYRTQEFIQIIQQEKTNGIYATFFDVGFRSKATALRYFRQQTGTTPSDYLQKALPQINNNTQTIKIQSNDELGI